jgi:hypothetical protein
VTTIGNGDSQVVTMQGFFEVIKGKYVLKNITLSLDERIFGEIEVKLK